MSTAETAIGGGNGVEVTYTETPKRRYTVNGQTVPSVTTVLDVFDKPGLRYWAQNMTVEGVVALHRQLKGKPPTQNFHSLMSALKASQLCFYQVTGDAMQRGTAVHAAAEAWINEGRIPMPGDYPESYQGFIRALGMFLMEKRPEFLESETIVGSAEHGYAGRLDTRARIAGEVGILDFKTAKRVYPGSHFPQLAGYDLAAIECGAEPSDFQAVVRLGVDGEYEMVRSHATHFDFLCMLAAYRALKRVEGKR